MDFKDYSFMDGTVVNNDLMFLLGVNDKRAELNESHGFIFQRYKKQWQILEVGQKLISSTFTEIPDRKLVAIAENGWVTALGGGMIVNESIAKGDMSPAKRGPLLEVKAIDRGKAYAIGTGRQAYRKDGEDLWTRIDQTASPEVEKAADVCFHSIDGFNENDIYSVGWEGEIWHFDGKIWKQMESPTNLALYKVLCCNSDGYVYACGQVGTLIRGRNNEWKVIDQDETKEDFWSVDVFDNQIYLSTLNFIYHLKGSELRQVQMDDLPLTCYSLSSAEGIMWSIGAKDVMEFSGNKWTRVV